MLEVEGSTMRLLHINVVPTIAHYRPIAGTVHDALLEYLAS